MDLSNLPWAPTCMHAMRRSPIALTLCCNADYCVVTTETPVAGQGALTGTVCAATTCPYASAGSVCYHGGMDCSCILCNRCQGYLCHCLDTDVCGAPMHAAELSQHLTVFSYFLSIPPYLHTSVHLYILSIALSPMLPAVIAAVLLVVA